MQAPVVSSMSFDKSSYTPGQTVTLTVVYQAGLSDQSNATTYTATDQTTGETGTLTISFVVADAITDPTVGSVTDVGHRQWTKVSDNGTTTAVWTTVA